MSDETYYTVLNVKETASSAEIKTAYRDLIKQVHPDTIANLAPYLRKIAEDKAKEIIEASTVLSDSSKRRDYDRQLAAYRRQNAPQAPPQPTPPPPTQQATSQTSTGPFCNKCGTSLYASGFCPKCNKFTAPTSTPPRPKTVRWLGYNWAPLMRWSREHPMLILVTSVFLAFVIASVISGNDTSSQSTLNCAPSQRVEVNGRFVCPQASVQPQTTAANKAIPPPPAGFTIVSEQPAPSKPTVSASGTYLGTVHNKTVNLRSTFTTVLHQTKSGTLEGCMEVKPPLYGSGVLRGSIRGSHINFVVADITFQGEASKNAISGSYVVSRQDGNQLGDFHLTRQVAAEPSYRCDDGVLTAVAKVVPSSSQQFSDVPVGSTVLPPAANLTVQTPNALTTALKPPPETRAGPKQPDLSSLTSSERQSIESACSYAKYNQGPAAYDQCLVRQFEGWKLGPKQPDLSGLTSSERQSSESACSYAKYNQGPAAYNR